MNQIIWAELYFSFLNIKEKTDKNRIYGMRTTVLYSIFMMSTFFLSILRAQISPGDLTNAHAELEGISNCTQCHVLGKKVSDEKCLACHEEINTRMDSRRGFHSSTEVRGKDCATCHSEHHGRKFDMIRFDEENFDHQLTGYELTGAHQPIDCRQCHVPDFIDDPDLRKREGTFLGLEQDCISCHEDVHQNTLSSNNCASCHVTDAFSPAERFDHDDTNFALLGEHQTVDCIDCHQMEKKNGRDFQVFAGVTFTNCNSCHDDAHQNNLGTNCKQCHSEESFASLRRVNAFNHNQTHFPLKGAHNNIDCASCHNMEAAATAIFQDKLGIQTNECISCHEDVHENKFGTNCAKCHNEASFRAVSTDNFDHDLTSFELVGKHEVVDCRECHTASLTEPLPHNTCKSCHTDYHEGEFVAGVTSPDCAQCHSEDGFEVTLYTIEEHNQSQFPLEGAHGATPCFACHLAEDKWHFRDIGERCVDCHDDVHKGYIAEKYYPDQSCENCHLATTWEDNLFDHDLTAFTLSGVHAEQTCMACHSVSDKDHQNRYEGFLNLTSECAACHENVHDRQFEQNGITDCARCHGFDGWGMDGFNHDNTAFKLEGRHANIACEACHKPTEVDGNVFVQYKFKSFECVVCHQ